MGPVKAALPISTSLNKNRQTKTTLVSHLGSAKGALECKLGLRLVSDRLRDGRGSAED